MKHLRRILAMCLSIVMMCSVSVWAAHPFPEEIYPEKTVYGTYFATKYYEDELYGSVETGIYGTSGRKLNFPVPARCIDEFNEGYGISNLNYFEWYDTYYERFWSASHYAKIWFTYYRPGDPEVWCEEYLEAFEAYFKKPSQKIFNENSGELKYRVSDYSWNGSTLSVTCEADYDIKYTCIKEYDTYDYYDDDYYFTVTEEGRETMHACVVVSAKEDKDIVYIAKFDPFVLEPECLYKPQIYLYDRFINYYGYSQSEINNTVYKGTYTNSFDLTLPDVYDSEKHNVHVYFISHESIYDEYSCIPNYWTIFDSTDFCNEHNVSELYKAPETPGDANGDGTVNAADVAVLAKYLSGSDTTVSDNADYNGDYVISSVDLLLLRRKLAGMNV